MRRINKLIDREYRKLLLDCEKLEYYRKLGYTEVKQQTMIQDTVETKRARAFAQLSAMQPKLF